MEVLSPQDRRTRIQGQTNISSANAADNHHPKRLHSEEPSGRTELRLRLRNRSRRVSFCGGVLVAQPRRRSHWFQPS